MSPAALLASLEMSLELNLDATDRIFLVLTATLWLVSGAFARSYHADDPHRGSFFAWFLLTMTGNLGLVLAADILSFYLFFALMTFSAWGLVVHERHAEAFRAGRVYIVLAVLADLAILAGLFSLGAAASGAPAFGPELEAAWQTLAGGDAATGGGGLGARTTATLLLVGFGVKAGLLPLHVWLPLAHPVAPTVASALLSGAMIKGGVLAWLRFLPEGVAFPGLGAALLVVGVAAAFYGVVLGLAQDEAKTVLAYSSVSQMGFMTVAAGIMLHGPQLTALGAGAAAIYALHHGLAKGALFLSVGVVDRTRRWTRWRGRIPLLLLILLPALAIAGAPLTSGARAKGALEVALEQLGGPWSSVLKPLLLAAALGTTLILARFLVVLDRRGRASEPPEAGDATRGSGSAGAPPMSLVVPWGLLVAVSASAVLWLPLLTPALEVEVPPLLAHPLTAGLPVALGGLAAWMVWRRPRLMGPLRHLRVPPGDLLVPIEAALRRLPSLRSRIPEAVGTTLRHRGRALASRAGEFAQALADRDLLLMRGTVVGALLLILVGLLVVGAR